MNNQEAWTELVAVRGELEKTTRAYMEGRASIGELEAVLLACETSSANFKKSRKDTIVNEKKQLISYIVEWGTANPWKVRVKTLEDANKWLAMLKRCGVDTATVNVRAA